jgi:hypothetical protein
MVKGFQNITECIDRTRETLDERYRTRQIERFAKRDPSSYKEKPDNFKPLDLEAISSKTKKLCSFQEQQSG